MKNLTRRDFLRTTSLLAASPPLLAAAHKHKNTSELPARTRGPVQVNWLEGLPGKIATGTAFGVPWPMGMHSEGTEFSLHSLEGESVPIQTWKTATWPDGSLKWTGHAIAPDAPVSKNYTILPGKSARHASPVKTKEERNAILIDTGLIKCEIPRNGSFLISKVSRKDKSLLVNGKLTGMVQESPEPGAGTQVFSSEVHSSKVEQAGPIRAVVKVDGIHLTEKGREWLPFTVRFYFHAGSDAIRMAHTFVFDGDEQSDFIRGLGVRFEVPMRDEAYNRHVRFAGQNDGMWGEAVQGLTGLRRDPGESIRKAQVDGRKLPDIRTWPKEFSSLLHWVPKWGDFTLSQINANGFSIRKRTKSGHGWVSADQGTQSNGVGYVGGASGGVAFGMRDFWKLHPTQLDIRDASSETAQVTIWMWSPEAPPMDIRFYHDGLGQDVEGPLSIADAEGVDPSVPQLPYEKQVDALRITYEDYEPGFGTPHGIARSSDLYFKVVDSTPSRQELADAAMGISNPPQLVPRPGDIHRAGVFGNMWDLPNRATPQLKALENRLDWYLNFYDKEVEQRHWYGFWDYGDFMHTYDGDRNVWRYDVGGYAWDNSELSTDIWLWLTFLRSGNAKAFRLAEAMNRHNRDVDIYHLGRFSGLGTRHNVQHWGCSAKQLRISTSMNRRFHYFLTTDERTGDVLEEVVEADQQLSQLDARRKVGFDKTKTHLHQPAGSTDCFISVGTDFGAAVSNWLTAWERTGDPKYGEWIRSSMQAIGNSKLGFFTNRFLFNPETKRMTPPENITPTASHLSIMFGLPTVVSELIQLFDVPEFEQAWLDYCIYCNAPREEFKEKFGAEIRSVRFEMEHSRIMAFAANTLNDPDLAKRAARDFIQNQWEGMNPGFKMAEVSGPSVLNPVEAPMGYFSTNHSAQWGLAAIQNSALIPKAISQNSSRPLPGS